MSNNHKSDTARSSQAPRGAKPANRDNRDNRAQRDERPRQPRRPYLEDQSYQGNHAFGDSDLLAKNLRELKRQEYKTKQRDELSPVSSFAPMPSVSRIGRPGVDHINTSCWPQDDLSAAFSVNNAIPFDFPPLGVKIPTLFHLFVYLYQGARQTTTLMSSKSQAGQGSLQNGPVTYTNRYAIFAYAVYLKLLQTPVLQDVAKSTTLPFDYYVLARHDGRQERRRVAESSIIAAAFKEARLAVKKDRPMNLVPFFDLDYQVELEEIKDHAERFASCVNLINVACLTAKGRLARAQEQAAANKAGKGKPKDEEGSAAPTDVVDASVTDYKAMGGDWSKATPEQTAAAEEAVVGSLLYREDAAAQALPAAPEANAGTGVAAVMGFAASLDASAPAMDSANADPQQLTMTPAAEVAATESSPAEAATPAEVVIPPDETPAPQDRTIVLDAFAAPAATEVAR